MQVSLDATIIKYEYHSSVMSCIHLDFRRVCVVGGPLVAGIVPCPLLCPSPLPGAPQ